MNVAQETLGFRRAGLSPALSLLMSAFALPIPPADLSIHLHRRRERSSTAQESDVRDQGSERRLADLIMPWSILAISSYSSRQRSHVSVSIYPRSRQYRVHTRISSAELADMRRKRWNSILDRDCRPKPSAMFAHTLLLDRRIWSARPYCSSRGNFRL